MRGGSAPADATALNRMRGSLLVGALTISQVIEPQVELPPEAPKPAPIIERSLPTEPPPAEKLKPSPAALEKRAARPQPPAPEPAPKPTAECEIKPVMTDDDLRACGALR